MNKFIVIPGSDHVFQALFKDIENMENIEIVKDLFRTNKIEGQIKKIKRRHIIWNCFKQLFLFFFSDKYIDKRIKAAKEGAVLVFSNISIRYISLKRLEKLKNKGVKLVLYFIDSTSNPNSKEALSYTQKIKIDLIYTFDLCDAKKFNFIHFHTMYSKIYNDKDCLPIEYDAMFNGTDKGRYYLLCDIMKKCSNTKFFINMICISDEMKKKAGFQSNTSIKYSDSLYYVTRSNCIIDIVLDKQQTGLSLRVYEALVYNKKLLTNNPSIMKFPYYNTMYMKYFKSIDDIDEEFIRERVNVDYGYKGEFSPIHFLEDISKRLSNE